MATEAVASREGRTGQCQRKGGGSEGMCLLVAQPPPPAATLHLTLLCRPLCRHQIRFLVTVLLTLPPVGADPSWSQLASSLHGPPCPPSRRCLLPTRSHRPLFWPNEFSPHSTPVFKNLGVLPRRSSSTGPSVDRPPSFIRGGAGGLQLFIWKVVQ